MSTARIRACLSMPTGSGSFAVCLGVGCNEQLIKSDGKDCAFDIEAVMRAVLDYLRVDFNLLFMAIAHFVDFQLPDITLHRVPCVVKRAGIVLKQTYFDEVKRLRRKAFAFF